MYLSNFALLSFYLTHECFAFRIWCFYAMSVPDSCLGSLMCGLSHTLRLGLRFCLVVGFAWDATRWLAPRRVGFARGLFWVRVVFTDTYADFFLLCFGVSRLDPRLDKVVQSLFKIEQFLHRIYHQLTLSLTQKADWCRLIPLFYQFFMLGKACGICYAYHKWGLKIDDFVVFIACYDLVAGFW